MSKLRIETDWEDPRDAQGPELRATWARLEILVDEEPLTLVEDSAARTTRPYIYGPLYPLAEWVACNWWSLLNEVYSPKRPNSRDYDRRHSLLAASEGFALPHFRIQPDGDQVLLSWQSQGRPSWQVRFLRSGNEVIERESLQQVLRDFVNKVVARLDSFGIQETLLSMEWNAIVGADSDERDFCMAVGRLGGDPYSIDDDLSNSILRFHEELKAETAEEFFFAADSSQLRKQGQRLLRFVESARENDVEAESLVRLRERVSSDGAAGDIEGGKRPWEKGYAAARRLRAALGTSQDKTIPTVKVLAETLGVDEQTWNACVEVPREKWRFLDAAIATNQNGSPILSLERRGYEASMVFACCRGLYEYFTGLGGAAGLATSAQSKRQKMNRAFAAEFLAPAARLSDMVSGSIVSSEELQDLAAEIGTSDLVIRHQITNHRIAEIDEWPV